MEEAKIHGGLLARNTAFNFAGSLVPLGVSLVATPYVIHGLGVERFGVLTLAWAILWYSSYFDFGLTRATTKFASEAIGRRQPEKIPAILWTSLGIQSLLGVLAAAAIALAAPFLVYRVLHIPPILARESELAFYWIGITIPFFLTAGILSALLAGVQRFDLVNAVKIPGNSLMFLLPALGVFLGYRLPGIVALILLSRALVALALLLTCWRVFPGLLFGPRKDDTITMPLLKFGGWVMVCNVLIPVLVYVDRFVIGAVLSIADVAYYALPFEVVSRLQIIPGSIGAVLFPAAGTLHAGAGERLTGLYVRSLKSILLLIAPAALVLIAFAQEGLRLWVGPDFAEQSGRVLQILSLGLLLNALGQVPTNFLDGIGRPEVRAKIFMTYTLPYLCLLWALVKRYGIEGAAMAWTARSAVELAIFFVVVARLLRLPFYAFAQNGLLKAAGISALLTLLMAGVLGCGLILRGTAIAILLIAFCWLTWLYVLDGTERHSLRNIMKPW